MQTTFWVKYDRQDTQPELLQQLRHEIDQVGWLETVAPGKFKVTLYGENEWDLANIYRDFQDALDAIALGYFRTPNRPQIREDQNA